MVCPDQANIRNAYHLPGTSLIFTPPKLVVVKNPAEQKTLCAAADSMTSLDTSKIQLQKRTYNTAPTALLDFAIRNFNPQALTARGGDFDAWWMTYVYPDVQKTYENFNISFRSMVEKQLLPKFESKTPSNNNLAQDMTTAYMFEVETYIDILQKTYIPKDAKEQKQFANLINDYRKAISSTLNTYKKNKDVRPQYVKVLGKRFRRAVPENSAKCS